MRKAHRLGGSCLLSSDVGSDESLPSTGGARALNLAAIAATAFRLFRTRSSKSAVTPNAEGALEIEGSGGGAGCGMIGLRSGRSDGSEGPCPCWVGSGVS